MVCKKKPAVKRKTTKKTTRKSKGNWGLKNDDQLSKKEIKSLLKQMKDFKKTSGRLAWKGK